MELIWEAYHLGINPQPFQGHKNLLTLFDRASQVKLIVQHQGRCARIPYKCDR